MDYLIVSAYIYIYIYKEVVGLNEGQWRVKAVMSEKIVN